MARSSTELGCLSGQRTAGGGGVRWHRETHAGRNGRALKYLRRFFDAGWKTSLNIS